MFMMTCPQGPWLKNQCYSVIYTNRWWLKDVKITSGEKRSEWELTDGERDVMSRCCGGVKGQCKVWIWISWTVSWHFNIKKIYPEVGVFFIFLVISVYAWNIKSWVSAIFLRAVLFLNCGRIAGRQWNGILVWNGIWWRFNTVEIWAVFAGSVQQS